MTTQPLKLPVVITVQGDQARAGFNKLGTQLKNLEAGVGKFFGGQVSAVGGMLAGFFTVQALISGVQKVLEHGQAVIDRVSQYNSEALSAQARLEAAQLRQDVAMGSVLGPDIAAVAQQKQTNLPTTAQVDAATASLKLSLDSQLNSWKSQFGDLMAGDYASFFKKELEMDKAFINEYVEIFTPDALYEAEQKLRTAQAIMPLPTPVAPGAQMTDQDAANAAVIKELQEQVRQLRAMNRTVGAN